jgi:hypothetical protein
MAPPGKQAANGENKHQPNPDKRDKSLNKNLRKKRANIFCK